MSMRQLVKEGATEYKIVIPSIKGIRDNFIAEEFRDLIKAASGADLSIVNDKNYDGAIDGKIISFGYTDQLKASGLTAVKDLGASGFIIKTYGDAVYVFGKDNKSFGTMYGGYELLTRIIDFAEYGIDCTYYSKSADVNIPDLDVMDVPDIEYRKDSIDFQNDKHRNRLRFISWNELLIHVPGYGEGHNSFGYVDPKLYKESHPEWFIKSGQQLSLSAHGNAQSAKELADVAFNSLVKFVTDNPDKDYITFAMQDADTMDREEIDYAINRYGALSGLWVDFLNGLAVRLRKYFAEKSINRKVKLVFYAYVKLQSPPVKKGTDGKYYPTIKADEDVIPFFCPIFMHQGVGIDHERNFADKKRLDNWQLVSKEVWVWFYNACFHDMIFPRYGFDAIAPSIRYIKKIGIPFFFSEGQTGNHNPWNFGELQTYLEARLSWKTDLDPEILIDDWFNHYYLEAALPMKKIFLMMRDNFRECTEKYDLRMLCDIAEYKVFRCNPREYISSALELISEAYAAVEKYKDSDSDLYEKLYKRITMIRISFLYLRVWLYKNDYDDGELYAKKKEIYDLCIKAKATHWTENLDPKGNLENLWTYWGVI